MSKIRRKSNRKISYRKKSNKKKSSLLKRNKRNTKKRKISNKKKSSLLKRNTRKKKITKRNKYKNKIVGGGAGAGVKFEDFWISLEGNSGHTNILHLPNNQDLILGYTLDNNCNNSFLEENVIDIDDLNPTTYKIYKMSYLEFIRLIDRFLGNFKKILQNVIGDIKFYKDDTDETDETDVDTIAKITVGRAGIGSALRDFENTFLKGEPGEPGEPDITRGYHGKFSGDGTRAKTLSSLSQENLWKWWESKINILNRVNLKGNNPDAIEIDFSLGRILLSDKIIEEYTGKSSTVGRFSTGSTKMQDGDFQYRREKTVQQYIGLSNYKKKEMYIYDLTATYTRSLNKVTWRHNLDSIESFVSDDVGKANKLMLDISREIHKKNQIMGDDITNVVVKNHILSTCSKYYQSSDRRLQLDNYDILMQRTDLTAPMKNDINKSILSRSCVKIREFLNGDRGLNFLNTINENSNIAGQAFVEPAEAAQPPPPPHQQAQAEAKVPKAPRQNASGQWLTWDVDFEEWILRDDQWVIKNQKPPLATETSTAATQKGKEDAAAAAQKEKEKEDAAAAAQKEKEEADAAAQKEKDEAVAAAATAATLTTAETSTAAATAATLTTAETSTAAT
jgi:hypothetical protein